MGEELDGEAERWFDRLGGDRDSFLSAEQVVRRPSPAALTQAMDLRGITARETIVLSRQDYRHLRDALAACGPYPGPVTDLQVSGIHVIADPSVPEGSVLVLGGDGRGARSIQLALQGPAVPQVPRKRTTDEFTLTGPEDILGWTPSGDREVRPTHRRLGLNPQLRALLDTPEARGYQSELDRHLQAQAVAHHRELERQILTAGITPQLLPWDEDESPSTYSTSSGLTSSGFSLADLHRSLVDLEEEGLLPRRLSR